MLTTAFQLSGFSSRAASAKPELCPKPSACNRCHATRSLWSPPRSWLERSGNDLSRRLPSTPTLEVNLGVAPTKADHWIWVLDEEPVIECWPMLYSTKSPSMVFGLTDFGMCSARGGKHEIHTCDHFRGLSSGNCHRLRANAGQQDFPDPFPTCLHQVAKFQTRMMELWQTVLGHQNAVNGEPMFTQPSLSCCSSPRPLAEPAWLLLPKHGSQVVSQSTVRHGKATKGLS